MRRIAPIVLAWLCLAAALDAQSVEKIIRKNSAILRYCYERELQKKPDLRGKIVVKFSIEQDGKVRSAKVESSTLQDATVEACIVDRFKKMKFPASDEEAVVRYPIMFSPPE